jgi:hypothetical protein
MIYENANANDSIRFKFEFDSNEIDESDLHDSKHDAHIISIVPAISIFDETQKLQVNQKFMFNLENIISCFNRDPFQFRIFESRTINELHTSWNHN